MLRFFATAVVVLLGAPSGADPAVMGLWLTQDREGVIPAAPCDGGFCARIVGVFLDGSDDPVPLDYPGMSQCHLELITDAHQIQTNLWKRHILDPRNGMRSGVELHIDPRGNFLVCGFPGMPRLGKPKPGPATPAPRRPTAASCR